MHLKDSIVYNTRIKALCIKTLLKSILYENFVKANQTSVKYCYIS